MSKFEINELCRMRKSDEGKTAILFATLSRSTTIHFFKKEKDSFKEMELKENLRQYESWIFEHKTRVLLVMKLQASDIEDPDGKLLLINL